MADNSVLPATGDVIAADDIGGVKHQLVKIEYGAPDSATQVSSANPLPVVGVDVTASGVLNAQSQAITLPLTGQSSGAAQITGAWVGTITFEASLDGVVWTAINAVSASTSAPQTTTMVNGLYRLTPGGVQQFRAIMTLLTSGAANVSLRASEGVGGIFANQILPAKITDGVSTAAIKPASTAAAATDAAIVVAISPNNAVPVTGTFFLATQPISGTVTINAIPVGANSIGNLGTVSTVTTVSTLTTLANGQTAHSSASTGSPVRVAGRVNTAVDTTLVAGDVSDLFITTSGAVVQKPFAAPELDWQFASAAGGIVNTTDVVLKTAGAAGVRNYLTGISIQNSAAIATEVVVKDGATVIWRGFVGASAALSSVIGLVFPTPLRGTAATALNVACITTASAVYVNAQGYQAP